MDLKEIADNLIQNVKPLRFSSPVTHVYNPLIYARKPYDRYCEQYGQGQKDIVLFGMNPGPWGMAQTGVPFGDAPSVKEWLGIEEKVGKPEKEHPKRPVHGFDCPRREVSGMRVWGWTRDTFGTPENFFDRFFIANYCPLCFMEESGRNRTPDKLPVNERNPLLEVCNLALRRTIELLKPDFVMGIGAFAEERARSVLDDMDIVIGRIPHPSPANPQANRGWGKAVESALSECGIKI